MSDLTVRLDVEVTVNAQEWQEYYNARPESDVTETIRSIILAWNERSRRQGPELHNIQVNLRSVPVPPLVVPVVKQEGSTL